MATFTTTLDYSCSLGGGARLQCWTILGDGATQSFQTGLLRGIAGWVQNQDDPTNTAVSLVITAKGGVSIGREIDDGKYQKLYVIGE
jgi:hypothetical protein